MSVFLTEWEYERTFDHEGKTYHLWSCQHREGYTAYYYTPQPPNGSNVSFVKPPAGTSHWVEIYGLSRNQGIPIELLTDDKKIIKLENSLEDSKRVWRRGTWLLTNQ